jgi:lipopolysaccharide transport system ATP-binding protein
MTKFAIEVRGLGKRYNIARENPLRKLERRLFPWMRNTGPSSPHGPAVSGESEFWALRDVSFNVSRGEAVGIIGHNGAGKSTLLKLLSRITPPTVGEAVVRGRVGTLLEVGTGFHPELTGRENIFLSGVILGLKHAEIVERFAQIVEFSGVEKFIDVPVKRYSSGMYVRLAFAVASSLDPDILIMDEVLAVGDAAFQKRSLERLETARVEEGRTVLFVSHNLAAIRSFCQRAIVLDRGGVVFDGGVSDAINFYMRNLQSDDRFANVNLKDRLNRTSGAVRYFQVECFDEAGAPTWSVMSGKRVSLVFKYRCYEPVKSLWFHFSLRAALEGTVLTTIRSELPSDGLNVGDCGEVTIDLEALPLRPNEYQLYVGLSDEIGQRFYDIVDQNVQLPLLSVESPSLNIYERDGVIDMAHSVRSRRLDAEAMDQKTAFSNGV